MPTSKEFMNRNSTDITRTRSRYERIAPFYDFVESPMDAIRFNQWRSRLREEVTGRALEVGVGTGKNISYYPSSADVTAIDISSGNAEEGCEEGCPIGPQSGADGHGRPSFSGFRITISTLFSQPSSSARCRTRSRA